MVFSPSENHKTTIKQLINRQFLYLNTSIFNGKCTTKCTTIKNISFFLLQKCTTKRTTKCTTNP
nr:MAG TPA: hypothetical protein [Caudoviricetes sp.]